MADRLNREEFLQSLLDPSAVIAPGFGIMTVDLKDGTSVGGFYIKEDKTHLTLKMTDKSTKKIALNQIKKKHKAISAMIPMKGILKPKELRDVIEYLSTLKDPKKKK